MSKDLPDQIRSVPQFVSLPLDSALYEEPQNSDVQLRALAKVILKYRYLIAVCTIVSLVMGLFYAFMTTPQYTARATLRISTYEPVLSATKIEDVLTQKSRESAYLETQISEISSYSLADKVLQEADFVDQLFPKSKPSWFSSFFGASANVQSDNIDGQVSGYKTSIDQIRNYLSLISVEPVRRTSIVAIQATSQSPILSAKIANAHAKTYIDWVRFSRIQQQSAGLRFLRAQSDELKQKVGDIEREVADYAESHSIVALNKDENITVQKMSQLNNLLTDATAQRIESEHYYKEAESSLDQETAGFDDNSIQTMRGKLVELQAEYGNMSTKFTPSYPRMQQLSAQIKNIKESITAQRKQIASGLKAKFQAIKEKEENLKEELEKQKSRTFELGKSQVQYNILNRELASSRELLESVLKQIKETSLAVESNSSNVAIIDNATIPRFASFPNKKMVAILATLLGLSIGLVISFTLNYLDNTIRNPEELSLLTNLPSLGVVPSFLIEQLNREIRTETKDPGAIRNSQSGHNLPSQTTIEGSTPLIYVESPQSVAAEAYRTIRTGILLSQAGEPPRAILVSSAQSSEGKTTSACNLAVTLASSGGRVILIDADLRRPSIAKYFGIDRYAPGLVEILTGQRLVEEVAVVTSIKRVTVVPSGRIPPNPAELLGSIEMARFVAKMRESFDYVIIDSPPVLPVTDSVILSRYLDGVLLVVKGGSTPKRVVRDAALKFKAVGARILGTILNDVDVTKGDYYYYNRYYSIYSQESRPENKHAAG